MDANGQSATAEGLFYQLIVRLHKFSLGRLDFKASVHWQRGLVLDDDYNGRALLEYVGTDVRITVRAAYPGNLLAVLTNEVKWLVEDFWEGLRCEVVVPCMDPCGKRRPGTGVFEVQKLVAFKRQGMTGFPCLVCPVATSYRTSWDSCKMPRPRDGLRLSCFWLKASPTCERDWMTSASKT